MAGLLQDFRLLETALSPLARWKKLLEEYGFGAQSGLKVIGQTLVRAGGSTLGYFRERPALEVAKNMSEWGGCHLAPFSLSNLELEERNIGAGPRGTDVTAPRLYVKH